MNTSIFADTKIIGSPISDSHYLAVKSAPVSAVVSGMTSRAFFVPVVPLFAASTQTWIAKNTVCVDGYQSPAHKLNRYWGKAIATPEKTEAKLDQSIAKVWRVTWLRSACKGCSLGIGYVEGVQGCTTTPQRDCVPFAAQ